jgi:hypothetical protein
MATVAAQAAARGAVNVKERIEPAGAMLRS